MAKKGKKPTKKTRRAKAPRISVDVEVLQNGATLLAMSTPLKRRGSLSLTTNGRGPLALPHYPLPEGRLEFLHFTATGAELDADYKWEGFATSKGVPINFVRGDKRGRRTALLQKGDYASITCDDLRIMLKVGPKKPGVRPDHRHHTPPASRRAFIAHFLPSIQEKRAIVAAAVATTIMVGAGVLALLNRPVHRPARLVDIREDYILPFVSPDHLRTGPEVLQRNLNRSEEVRSVLTYYQSVTALLTGQSRYDERLLFPTSIDLYQKLHEGARQTLADKLTRQKEIDHLQGMKASASVLTIPAVLGESMSGSMLRVIDKISIMQVGLEEGMAARKQIDQLFPKDPVYDWGDYKTVSNRGGQSKEANEVLKGMTGSFKALTDEEAMYAEADTLANRAATKQAKIFHNRAASETVTADSARPIGLPDGVKFASFVGDLDFMMADKKLYQLQGTEYGARVSSPGRVREPLVGEIEPKLIERYIRENRFQLQLCYELALRRNEAAAGTMEWSWRIDSRGVISDIALVATSIQDQRMAECIRKKIATWRFPRPRLGSVEVNYPFEFAPSKG